MSSRVLGVTRQFLLETSIFLLSLEVCAYCPYGMSQIDLQLVKKGVGVINSLRVSAGVGLQ